MSSEQQGLVGGGREGVCRNDAVVTLLCGTDRFVVERDLFDKADVGRSFRACCIPCSASEWLVPCSPFALPVVISFLRSHGDTLVVDAGAFSRAQLRTLLRDAESLGLVSLASHIESELGIAELIRTKSISMEKLVCILNDFSRIMAPETPALQIQLSGVCFARMNLSGMHFDRVRFRNCVMTGADLSDTFFCRCDFGRAQLQECILQRSRFEECILEETDFTNADLSGSVIVEGFLNRPVLAGAKAVSFEIAGCHMDNVDFSSADASLTAGLRFGHSKSAAFRCISFSKLTFVGSQFETARFNECSWTACRFINCNFSSADLVRCDFSASQFIDCTFVRSSGLSTKFCDCSFTHTPALTCVDFSYASLDQCSFAGSTLYRWNIAHSKLNKCDLRGTVSTRMYSNTNSVLQDCSRGRYTGSNGETKSTLIEED
eukprot:ANDGO_04800.mRNA.1 hypothetical protein GUITHDRAFT_135709